jgi:ATP-dependent Clp protease ATP-binding subunit ClpB
VFHPLSAREVMAIARLMMEETTRKLRARGIRLEVTEEAERALADAGFDPAYGARPLRRAIQREIETPLARRLIEGEFEPGDTVRVSHREGVFRFERMPTLPPAV